MYRVTSTTWSGKPVPASGLRGRLQEPFDTLGELLEAIYREGVEWANLAPGCTNEAIGKTSSHLALNLGIEVEQRSTLIVSEWVALEDFDEEVS